MLITKGRFDGNDNKNGIRATYIGESQGVFTRGVTYDIQTAFRHNLMIVRDSTWRLEEYETLEEFLESWRIFNQVAQVTWVQHNIYNKTKDTENE